MKRNTIQVAPIVPLPVNRSQVFSYCHDEDLPAGTLVSIPFYFREIQGVVIKNQKNFAYNFPKLKNIRQVIEKDFLNEKQLELAKKISDYYYSPLGAVIKLMVPKVVNRRSRSKASFQKKRKNRKAGEIAEKIIKSSDKKFLLVSDSQERENINFDLIREYIRKNKQCLILVPEIFFSFGVHEQMQEEFREEIALVHSRITKGQYFEQWKKIKSGKIMIVVSSKQGIFLPFSDLGLIIVQESQDISFKQWQAMPRYNAVRGAEFLSEISGAKMILEDSSIPADIFPEIGKKFQLIERDITGGNRPKIEIVSFGKDKKNSHFPISDALYGRMAEALENKQQAVIFINRRGFSTRSTCETCKRTLKCPKCEQALVYSEQQGKYQCLHCAQKMDLLSACPSCGGFQFSHRGIGTQTVEKKIKKLFPAAKVGRLDADIMRSSSKYKEITEKFSLGNIDVLVGTQSAIKGIYSDNVRLVGSISGRDLAEGAEFGSRESVLSMLFYMTNLLGGTGIAVIQSFFGVNPLFEIFSHQDLETFYRQETAIRRRLSYPPFRKLVKLVFRGDSEKKAVSESKKIFDLLKATGNNKIEIIGPYKPLSSQKRDIFERDILIKIEREKNIGDLPIRSVVGALRKGWAVDVDPVMLFRF